MAAPGCASAGPHDCGFADALPETAIDTIAIANRPGRIFAHDA
jgi:hypothetical protein